MDYNRNMSSSLPSPVWIDQPEDLQGLARELLTQPRLAVDTESNSLHAYRERVCLIQFSTPATDYLLDPLALPDLSPLTPIFANPKIEKVFHAIEYDIICLKRDFGFEVANIFDTMQATRILGEKQVGLDAILAAKLGIVINKKYQKADWADRPLSPEMLNYARLDTHYLLPLRDILQAELAATGRWDLAREEFVRMAKLNGNDRIEVPAWQRVAGSHKLDGRQLAILKELCDWRDQAARKLARPAFKVVDDKRLVAIALLTNPKYTDGYKEILTDYQRRRFGTEILRALKRGLESPPLSRPRPARPKQVYLNRANALSQWRKQAARKLHVESDIVLPRAWMQAIAEQNPSSRAELAALMPDSPWRLERFGEEILKAIR
jgi:ribonuclease D